MRFGLLLSFCHITKEESQCPWCSWRQWQWATPQRAASPSDGILLACVEFCAFHCKWKHCNGQNNSVPCQTHTFHTEKSTWLIAEESFVVEKNQREKGKKIGRKNQRKHEKWHSYTGMKRHFVLKTLLDLFIFLFENVNEYFADSYGYAPCAWLVITERKRSYLTPWNCH